MRTAPVAFAFALIQLFSLLYTPWLCAQDALQRQVDALLLEGNPFEPLPLLYAPEGVQMRTLESYLIDGDVLTDAAILRHFPEQAKVLTESTPGTISVELPLPSGAKIALLLYAASPLSGPLSEVWSAGLTAKIPLDMPATYRGVVQGHPGSIAALTVYADEVRAMVVFGGGTYVLGKVDGATDGAHVLYRTDDLRLPEGFSCQLIDDHAEMEDKLPSSTVFQGQSKTIKCVRVRVEIDNGLVNSLGGAAPAVNYILGLFNEVTTIFTNDNINVVVSEIFPWVGSSPYSGTVANRLNQMNNTSPNADLTALITNIGGGGIAYLGTVCSASFGTSVSSIFGFYNSVPTYSWDVNVVTHELGHNLSSPHTHACFWNGNNTPIDGCGIQAGYSEGNCGTAPLPTGGGTVMSYCHLIGGVGVNFSNGFGPQPRTRMVNYVNGRSCLGTVCTPYGGEPCADESLTLHITLDNFPSETSWQITVNGGTVVASGGNYEGNGLGATIAEELCLPMGCYTFTIFDTTGDGICCDLGNGSYTLTAANGVVLASGGDFGSSESTPFCAGIVGVPPCQNPYPSPNGLSAVVQGNGVALTWQPILGSFGCQIQGGLQGNPSLTTQQILQLQPSQFFIPANQLPVTGIYRVRVRCGCSLDPSVIGPWSAFLKFPWQSGLGQGPDENGTLGAGAMRGMHIYPNPSSGELQVEMVLETEERLTYRVMDARGVMVFAERHTQPAGMSPARVDLSALAEGVYLLMVEGERGPYGTQRFVIQR